MLTKPGCSPTVADLQRATIRRREPCPEAAPSEAAPARRADMVMHRDPTGRQGRRQCRQYSMLAFTTKRQKGQLNFQALPMKRGKETLDPTEKGTLVTDSLPQVSRHAAYADYRPEN